MDMDAYQATLEKIYRRQLFGIKLGLRNIHRLLERLGRPQDRFRALHVAGTNGKGSTAAFLHAILRSHARSAGLYTSPHLTDFRERIVCDECRISREEVLACSDEVDRALADGPGESSLAAQVTFFEYVTALAFRHFVRSGVEFAVVEVGLGGRLDATNVVDPEVAVITPVAHDHTYYLGETLEQIAAEKAGIIKPGRPVVLGPNSPSVNELIEEVCRRRGSRLLRAERDYRYRIACSPEGPATRLTYETDGFQLVDVPLNLLGRHQGANAAAAVTAALQIQADGLQLDPSRVAKALREVSWPGRLEIVRRRPHLVLDGAHNTHAIEALSAALRELVPYRRLLCVFGVMDDKDVEGMLSRMAPLVTRFFLAAPKIDRACKPERMADYLARRGHPHQAEEGVSQALEAAMADAGPEDLVLVTGSLFTVGEARSLLQPIERDGESSP